MRVMHRESLVKTVSRRKLLSFTLRGRQRAEGGKASVGFRSRDAVAMWAVMF